MIFTSSLTLHIYYSKNGAPSPQIVCIEKTSCFYCCLCDIILVRKRKAIQMQLIRSDDNSLRFVAFLLLMGQLNSGCGCGRATRQCISWARQTTGAVKIMLDKRHKNVVKYRGTRAKDAAGRPTRRQNHPLLYHILKYLSRGFSKIKRASQPLLQYYRQIPQTCVRNIHKRFHARYDYRP